MITKSMSIDFRADDILAVTIDPGWVSTDMGGPNAPVTPAQCAKGICQLMRTLSEEDNGKVLSWK